MTQLEPQCSLCAWRGDCKKKFNITVENGRVRCPDYSRDVAFKTEEKDGQDQA